MYDAEYGEGEAESAALECHEARISTQQATQGAVGQPAESRGISHSQSSLCDLLKHWDFRSKVNLVTYISPINQGGKVGEVFFIKSHWKVQEFI